MSQCVSIVGKHEYFLELTSSTDCELENVFLCFEDNAVKIVDSVANSYC